MQTDPSGYDFDTNRQKHRKFYQTAPYEDHKLEQIHLYYNGNGNLLPGYVKSSISGDLEVCSVYSCLAVEQMDIIQVLFTNAIFCRPRSQ